MWLHRPRPPLLRPLLTSRSGSPPSPFQAQGEISPGKNALLRCTTAGSTPPRLDHESFAVHRPLALLGSAFYPVLVHRLAASLHASSPHSVTPMQWRFARCDQLTAGLAPARVRPCPGRTMRKCPEGPRSRCLPHRSTAGAVRQRLRRGLRAACARTAPAHRCRCSRPAYTRPAGRSPVARQRHWCGSRASAVLRAWPPAWRVWGCR